MSKPQSHSHDTSTQAPYVLAFDTANEVIAIGVGLLHADSRSVEVVASVEAEAHRASNTQLLPRVNALLEERGITRERIACVVVGRGPGSFTGVRIALATAKGIASALGVALIGVSSLDAVAWNAWQAGARGQMAVVADAMRKEVYPVRFQLNDAGIERLEADRVVKAEAAAKELCVAAPLMLVGDALKKYGELFKPCGRALDELLWTPTGQGLLRALQALWQAGEVDPFDSSRHHPAYALPVYTRLSDAEENERIRLSKNDPRNLTTGVQDVACRRDQRASMYDTAILNARPDKDGIVYKPLDAAHAPEVAALETRVMGTDAWNEALVADELPRPDRVWWAAYGVSTACQPSKHADAAKPCSTPSSPLCAYPHVQSTLGRAAGESRALQGSSLTEVDQGQISRFDTLQLIGYAGGWIVDGQVQILKVGVDPAYRRQGVARALLARVAADARDLGATSCSLEVRAGNAGAQKFYEALDFHVLGTRPRYYSDGEDALIMEGPLPLLTHDVAGMELQVNANTSVATQANNLTNVSRETSPASSPTHSASASVQSTHPAHVSSHEHVSCETFVDQNSHQLVDALTPDEMTKLDAQRPLILAIESSCDETAAAIVDGDGNLVADVVASQVDFHARFGGVVPEIASRKHIEAICGVCDECFDVAAAALNVPRLTWSDLDAVAVTYAPGLLGALVVGVAFAKGAAWACDLPLVGVHHLEGHLYANKIGAPDFTPPAVVSLVSGGNTLLVHMADWGHYETLGATIDDAVGEAFDKVAKALGLGYPGGPVISKQAAQGNPAAISFPRAMMHSGDLRFSLSGLKTAVVTYINKEREAARALNIPDICASFQQAVVDVQVKKAEAALKQTGAPTFCLGGGVAANPALRAAYEDLCERLGVRLVMPPFSACGDNAGMIALAALDRYRQQKFLSLDSDAQAHANLDDPY